MKLEEISIDKLIPWEKNPRCNNHAVEAVIKSIKAFGFNVPILCDTDYNVIAGHTRLKAAKKMGFSSIPVIILNLTEDQCNAFSIADNKTAEIADWDFPKLHNILEELKLKDFDLTMLGYTDEELQAILADKSEFNWDDFDNELSIIEDKEYINFPVKVRLKEKEKLLNEITNYAKLNNIKENDKGILAGLVIKNIFRIQ